MAHPYLSDVVKAVTGVDVPLPLATFGIFVALAMLAAGKCLRCELRRLYAAGRIGAARKNNIDVPPRTSSPTCWCSCCWPASPERGRAISLNIPCNSWPIRWRSSSAAPG